MTPKKLRQLTGLSQRAFASRIGVNKSTVERAEKSDSMSAFYNSLHQIYKSTPEWFNQ